MERAASLFEGFIASYHFMDYSSAQRGGIRYLIARHQKDRVKGAFDNRNRPRRTGMS